MPSAGLVALIVIEVGHAGPAMRRQAQVAGGVWERRRSGSGSAVLVAVVVVLLVLGEVEGSARGGTSTRRPRCQ